MRRMTVQELKDWEQDWMDREDPSNDLEYSSWIEEGINLYEQLIKADRQDSQSSIMLADLYTRWGRDEKIRRGNQDKAERILRRATLYSPERPDAFYHLSFIFAQKERQWEAALFYGKEALEKGVKGDKKIKLLCNLALGYAKLGFRKKARDYLREAKESDVLKNNEWFIELYADKVNHTGRPSLLLKEPLEKRKVSSRQELNYLIEESTEGKCVVLDLASDKKIFHGTQDTARLERREAEILGYLMDNHLNSCSRRQIEKAIWLEQEVSEVTVRRYIGTLRNKLSQALGLTRDDIEKKILITTLKGYMWKPDIPCYTFRR